ncbi:N-acylethanolamine-hydrolyzing acid amidase-like [Anomaloglossus baeobatrachus]
MSWIKLIVPTMFLMYFLLPLLTCSPSLTLKVKDYAAPRYNISLDLKPEQRWHHIMQNYNVTQLKRYIDIFFRMIEPNWSKQVLLSLADVYLHFFVEEPYAGEIRGIAKAAKLPTNEAVLLNLFYESMGCTSIIAEDPKGNIYHMRNMDLFYSDLFKEITIDVDFIRNGKVAYTGTTFLGFVGLWTGQRPYQFSISANAREDNNLLLKNIISLIFSGSPVSWLIRNTLNEAPDYESAVLQLSDTPIIAEIYLTVSGVNSGEGASITRDRRRVAHVEHLNASYGAWFLLRNNHDTWLSPPLHDRRWYFATRDLNATGQENINTDTLYKVLSTYPVLNSGTVHTTIMSAASPEGYVSMIRDKEGW